MVQDQLRDTWTLNGNSQQFDTLIASIPDAILMTQKALGVTPTEDGFQIQQGRNRNKNQGQGAANSGNNSSQKGLDRRNSAPDVLQQQQPQHPPRKPNVVAGRARTEWSLPKLPSQLSFWRPMQISTCCIEGTEW